MFFKRIKSTIARFATGRYDGFSDGFSRVASLDEGTLTAEFESPQFAPAPGQRLALYGGEVLAASGVIV